MRVRSVQLGGSLAGKLSSELSSTLSDKSVALGISGRRLRRPLVEPRIMDRGVTERCPEAERMNSALRMIQRLAVAAHKITLPNRRARDGSPWPSLSVRPPHIRPPPPP